MAAASETPRMALAPRRDLLGVPSSSISVLSMVLWSEAPRPDQRLGDLAVDVGDRRRRRPCRPRRHRRRAARWPRTRRSKRPRGPRPGPGAAFEDDFHLDGRVPRESRDLAGVDPFDNAHSTAQSLMPPAALRSANSGRPGRSWRRRRRRAGARRGPARRSPRSSPPSASSKGALRSPGNAASTRPSASCRSFAGPGRPADRARRSSCERRAGRAGSRERRRTDRRLAGPPARA